MDETDTPQNRSNDDAESKSSDENVSQNSLFFSLVCLARCRVRIIMAKNPIRIFVKCH